MSRNYQQHPELYPWVEPMTREIEMDQNPDFQRFYAALLAEQARCTCEGDGGYGDDGSEYRRTPNAGCPVHAQEDEEEEGCWIGDQPVSKIDDALITIEARPLDGTMAKEDHS